MGYTSSLQGGHTSALQYIIEYSPPVKKVLRNEYRPDWFFSLLKIFSATGESLKLPVQGKEEPAGFNSHTGVLENRNFHCLVVDKKLT